MHLEVAFDKLALYDDNLVLLSAVGAVQDCKAFRAGLNSRLTHPIKIDRVKGEGKPHCFVATHGYAVYAHRLGYDMLHAIYVARMPGLIFDDSDDSLWHELMTDRYQTPLLRQWVPHIRRELTDHPRKLLQQCECVGCKVFQLTATTEDLDEIVSNGLKDGVIKIEEAA